MLESKEITKVYGRKTAVNHVSLKLTPGFIYAMLGPNGSGKTTWMKMAAGLVKPTSGGMYFDGRPLDIDSRRRIAYMSTEPYFYTWMKVSDVGKYYQDFFEDFSMEQYHLLLERMQLTPDLKTSSLSSGMMAKLKIAVTMARDSDVIMLDEPLNGIDLLARDQIMQSIVERVSDKRILLISSHLVEEMEAIADRAVFIRSGVLMEVRDLEEMREVDGVSMADRYRAIFGHGEVQA